LKGDYQGFYSWIEVYFLFVLQTSLGDFSVNNFKHLPLLTMYTLWIMWVILVIINSMIFLNFLIAVISDIYAEHVITRVEESYQKKAEILVDLYNVFGPWVDVRSAQILVTRTSNEEIEREEDLDAEVKSLKKQILVKFENQRIALEEFNSQNKAFRDLTAS